VRADYSLRISDEVFRYAVGKY